MRLKFKLVSLFLAFFLFWGSIGANVFIHECAETGKSISVYFQQDDPCEEEHEVSEVGCQSSCCNQKSKGFEAKKCCSEKSAYFQIDAEFHQDVQSDVHFTKSISFNPKESTQFSVGQKTIKSNYFDSPPRFISGRTILIQNQTFLI